MNKHMVFYKIPKCGYYYPFRFWFGYAIPLIMSNDSWLTPKHFLDTQKGALHISKLHNMGYCSWIW